MSLRMQMCNKVLIHTLQDLLLLLNTHPQVCMVTKSTNTLKEFKEIPKMLFQKEKFLVTND